MHAKGKVCDICKKVRAFRAFDGLSNSCSKCIEAMRSRRRRDAERDALRASRLAVIQAREARTEQRLKLEAVIAGKHRRSAALMEHRRAQLKPVLELARRNWQSLSPSERTDSAYWSQQARTLIGNLKMSPCADCGNSFMSCAMDFDHVRGTKLFSISSMLSAGVWWRGRFELLQREIEKCEVVCAVCHRIRTWNRKQISKRKIGDLLR